MKYLLSIILFMGIVIQTANLSSIIHPVALVPQKTNPLRQAAIKTGLGDPGEKILDAVSLANRQTGLSEPLLLSLMYSESSFKPQAVSRKSYQGLMQIPRSREPMHRDEDVNTLIGAKILVEKLKITDGDYRKAITIYKGWAVDHPEGKRQADKVILLWHES